MDDLISRKALIEEFNFWYECLGGTMNQKNWIVQDTISSAIDTINEARGVEAEPVKHGEWVATRKHQWERDEDGEVDDWAWESGFHNGVSCEICHKHPCVHCDPDYDENQDCHEHYVCSECGRIALALEPYCHCGAKMDNCKN